MQARNEVAQSMTDIMRIRSGAFENEVLQLATVSLKDKKTKNKGTVGGQVNMTTVLDLSDFNCLGANPVTCDPDDRFR